VTMGQVRRIERALRELDELAAELGERWDDVEFDPLATARTNLRIALRAVEPSLLRRAS
jgi:hypothetical protein